MPELAEVERARRLLQQTTAGAVWSSVTTTADDIVYVGIKDTEFADIVRGQTIDAVERYGKWFYFKLADNVTYIFMHFGMTGCLKVRGGEGAYYRSSKKSDDAAEWPPKYCKFAVGLSSGTQFAFCDARRLARIRVVRLATTDDSIREHKPLSELGFDPVLCMPSKDTFASMVQQRGPPIKALLLDQGFSAGIGNWIADEVLYQAHIHPESKSSTLPREQVDALHDAIVNVVTLACEANADHTKFPDTWLFHHRWSKGSRSKTPPKMPDGRRIEFVTVGGRTSAVVAGAQIKYGKGKKLAAASSRKESKQQPAAGQSDPDDSDLSSLDEEPEAPPNEHVEIVPVAKKPPRRSASGTSENPEPSEGRRYSLRKRARS
ncbi:hypothetical protein RI367_003542 [Sorochytrium milnesiophthora]